MNKIFGTGVLSGKMLLVKPGIVENNNIDTYFRKG